MWLDEEVEFDPAAYPAETWTNDDILTWAKEQDPDEPVEMSSVDKCPFCWMARDKFCYRIPWGASLVGDFTDVSYKDPESGLYVLLATFPSDLMDLYQRDGADTATTYGEIVKLMEIKIDEHTN